jgi:hypothetical protein
MKSSKRVTFKPVEIASMALIVVAQISIGVPSYVSKRESSRLQVIISNLKLIEAAKEECAMDLGFGQPSCTAKSMTDPDNGYLDAWPIGPVEGEYVENALGTNPTFRGKDVHAWKADSSGL